MTARIRKMASSGSRHGGGSAVHTPRVPELRAPQQPGARRPLSGVRERPAATRRRSSGTRLLGLAAALLCALLGLAAWKLELTRLVSLEAVLVEGASAAGDEELLRLADLRPGQSLLFLDRAAIAARLRSDPRVEQASVELDWPSRVVLHVRERTPVAFVFGHGLLDASGHFWQEDRRAASLDLPLVTGLHDCCKEAEQLELLAELGRLLAELDRALPELSLSELALSADGPVLYFEEGVGPVLVGFLDYEHKLELLGRLLAAHPEMGRRPLDLRWQNRVVVSGAREPAAAGPSA